MFPSRGFGGVVRTVVSAVPLHTRTGEGASFTVPLKEGGALLVRSFGPPSREAVVLLHGIGGSSESAYIRRAVRAFVRHGHRTYAVNLRGAGDGIGLAESLYHAGLSSDVDALVAFLSAKGEKLWLVGFSGGGSVALKLSGEWGERAPKGVLGVVSISAPLDYEKVARHMDTTFVFRAYVLRHLKRQAALYAGRAGAHFDQAALKSLRTFRAYDSAVVVPMHGFSDVDTYYREASSGPHLPHIRVPTLLLHADDDPMIPAWSLDPWIHRVPSHVTVRRTHWGGHNGWMEGLREDGWVMTWPVRQALSWMQKRGEPATGG